MAVGCAFQVGDFLIRIGFRGIILTKSRVIGHNLHPCPCNPNFTLKIQTTHIVLIDWNRVLGQVILC